MYIHFLIAACAGSSQTYAKPADLVITHGMGSTYDDWQGSTFDFVAGIVVNVQQGVVELVAVERQAGLSCSHPPTSFPLHPREKSCFYYLFYDRTTAKSPTIWEKLVPQIDNNCFYHLLSLSDIEQMSCGKLTDCSLKSSAGICFMI
jgi:hypothetical protein